MNMMKHMWENKLLSDYKHGFVEGRSCTSRLLAVLEAWTRILDSGNAVDAIYLDFRKAFDTVPLWYTPGSVLNPVLFVIINNDLPDVVKQSVQMFADDTKMWSKLSNLQGRVYLQEDIDKLQK